MVCKIEEANPTIFNKYFLMKLFFLKSWYRQTEGDEFVMLFPIMYHMLKSYKN